MSEDLDGLVEQLVEAGVITESRVADNVDLATGKQALKRMLRGHCFCN